MFRSIFDSVLVCIFLLRLFNLWKPFIDIPFIVYYSLCNLTHYAPDVLLFLCPCNACSFLLLSGMNIKMERNNTTH